MSKIVVLISTYNGVKYLKEQINSVLGQTDVDLDILVRDDGSTDGTLDLLKYYSCKYRNFSYYADKNIGAAKSFLDLVAKAPVADYYAFCDQDDVWDPCKLKKAIEMIKSLPIDKPNLYYSNLRIVSADLSFSRMRFDEYKKKNNKYSALVENLCAGCTAVFNYTAKRMMSEQMPEEILMHDYWLYLLCSLLGNVIYDSNAFISYRQHEANTVGISLKRNSFSLLKEHFLRLLNRKYQPRLMNTINFEKCFGKYLDNIDKQKIKKIINYKSSIKNRIKLFLDNDIKPSGFWSIIRFKSLVLLGII